MLDWVSAAQRLWASREAGKTTKGWTEKWGKGPKFVPDWAQSYFKMKYIEPNSPKELDNVKNAIISMYGETFRAAIWHNGMFVLSK